MPVISFCNPKGGTGKTTAALLLASELASRGAQVALIDADPERWISQWEQLPGKPANIEVINGVAEDTVVDRIDAASAAAQFVIVDLEGTSNLLVANAIGMSDLVVIPMQGAIMDGKGAGKMVRLVRSQERMMRRTISHVVLFTRTSAAITTRDLRYARDQLAEAKVPVLMTSLVERAAYRALLTYGGLLTELDRSQVRNLDKAIENAREYMGEVLAMLKTTARRAA